MKSSKNDRCGLSAIDPYEIERHWFLDQLRHERAKERVHGLNRGYEMCDIQRQLRRIRKEHYR